MSEKPFVMKKLDSKKKVIELDDILKEKKLEKTVLMGKSILNVDKTMLVNINDIEFEKETFNISDLLLKKEKKIISVEEILTSYDNYEENDSKISSLYHNHKDKLKNEVSIIESNDVFSSNNLDKDEDTINIDDNDIFSSNEFEKDEDTTNIDDEISIRENYFDIDIEFEVKTLLNLIKKSEISKFNSRLRDCQKRYDSNVFTLIRFMFDNYVKN